MTAVALRLLICALAVVFASCTSSTGILPAGPNTYTVTEGAGRIIGGSMTAQKNALAEAIA